MVRRIYQYMNREEKEQAMRLVQADLEELRKELGKEYPRVVRDAIEETIRRYTQDVEFLRNELKQP